MEQSSPIKHLLIPFNVQNKNGRIYTKESFASLKDEYAVEFPLQPYQATPDVNLASVRGVVDNLESSDEGLFGELKLLDTPYKTITQSMINDDLVVIRPKSVAKIDEGVMNWVEIICFQFLPKDDDSFNV